ncbi:MULTISPECIES: hypothetical protein [Streptomyces]|uniref:Uncharacterized protein n=1 Tax=Streptomyces canarius TaxID=285453 RepID=A0ABQ3CQR9_9ACTN|nr:hypothetical protein [Streptomyces canarius]GHA39501.1 hypothetical protein GCM10010345_50150 [Streptomyces canarius]
MILIALLVPVLMIAFLFITPALEELLFPLPETDDVAVPPAHAIAPRLVHPRQEEEQ